MPPRGSFIERSDTSEPHSQARRWPRRPSPDSWYRSARPRCREVGTSDLRDPISPLSRFSSLPPGIRRPFGARSPGDACCRDPRRSGARTLAESTAEQNDVTESRRARTSTADRTASMCPRTCADNGASGDSSIPSVSARSPASRTQTTPPAILLRYVMLLPRGSVLGTPDLKTGPPKVEGTPCDRRRVWRGLR